MEKPGLTTSPDPYEKMYNSNQEGNIKKLCTLLWWLYMGAFPGIPYPKCKPTISGPNPFSSEPCRPKRSRYDSRALGCNNWTHFLYLNVKGLEE